MELSDNASAQKISHVIATRALSGSGLRFVLEKEFMFGFTEMERDREQLHEFLEREP